MCTELFAISQRLSVRVLGRARHCAARATSRQPGAAHAVVVAEGAAAAQRRSVSVEALVRATAVASRRPVVLLARARDVVRAVPVPAAVDDRAADRVRVRRRLHGRELRRRVRERLLEGGFKHAMSCMTVFDDDTSTSTRRVCWACDHDCSWCHSPVNHGYRRHNLAHDNNVTIHHFLCRPHRFSRLKHNKA